MLSRSGITPRKRWGTEMANQYCEDYPCCGHTALDPCARQWYDEPDAFDLSKNPHALCDHENGDCDVPDLEEDENYDG